jgi:hypothetical protein
MLCFLCLRRQTLDIRNIGLFLCRKNGRYKSTLCKLYQVAHILEAAGVLVKAETPGEITVPNEFFVPIDLKTSASENPFAIRSLLNKEEDDQGKVIERRRARFDSECRAGMPKGDVTVSESE